MNFRKWWVVCVSSGLLLSACAPAAPVAPAMPAAGICRIASDVVSGASERSRLIDAKGARVVLRGPDLPSMLGMERAGQAPLQVLEDAAAAGAGVVRVAVVDAEFTPTYVPLKLLPLAKKADELGITLILSWRNDPTSKLNKQADDAEDFLRLAVQALRAYPNVWLDPFHDALQTPESRQRAVAVRMVDIVRGLGDSRIVVIHNAGWLNSDDADTRAPIPDANVIYGVRTIQAGMREDVPLLLLADDADAPVFVQLVGGGDPLGRADLRAWGKSGRCR